jgi:hypothetical protein
MVMVVGMEIIIIIIIIIIPPAMWMHVLCVCVCVCVRARAHLVCMHSCSYFTGVFSIILSTPITDKTVAGFCFVGNRFMGNKNVFSVLSVSGTFIAVCKLVYMCECIEYMSVVMVAQNFEGNRKWPCLH